MEGLYTSKEFLKRYFKLEIPQSICSFIVRKEILKDIRFNRELSIGEDLDFQIRVMLLNAKIRIYYTADIYFYYHVRENSAMTSKKFNEKDLNILYYLDKLRNEIPKDMLREFEEYQIVRFFLTIRDVSNRNISEQNYEILKKELSKYDCMLKKLKILFSKKFLLLLSLKKLYRFNLKVFLYCLKIKNRICNK